MCAQFEAQIEQSKAQWCPINSGEQLHGIRDHISHSRITLDGGNVGSIVLRGDDAGQQGGDRRTYNTCLTEARQHVVDVARPRRVWSNDQNP